MTGTRAVRKGRRVLVVPEGPPCASCGAPPTGTYRDGSPSYSCFNEATHKPIYPERPT